MYKKNSLRGILPRFRIFFICLHSIDGIFILMKHTFTNIIIQWYRANGRNLPWRETKDPYKIWVSEIILQQTRVAQGISYYLSFIDTFPNVEALASASEEEVLLLWQGLGYYSRARNMHCAAKQIVEAGGFPVSYKELLKLKGVGKYTAAAISSFAFGGVNAVLDGNVFRVLSRYFGIETPIDSASARKQFQLLAQELIDVKRPALYNQAIMDFGAMQCLPKGADCRMCPLQETCFANRQNMVGELPVKKRVATQRERCFNYFFVVNENSEFLVQKRCGKDIWQHLYQLPLVETDRLLLPVEASEMFPAHKVELRVPTMIHVLSHQQLKAQCFVLYANSDDNKPFEGVWIARHSVGDYVFPQLIIRIFDKLFQ